MTTAINLPDVKGILRTEEVGEAVKQKIDDASWEFGEAIANTARVLVQTDTGAMGASINVALAKKGSKFFMTEQRYVLVRSNDPGASMLELGSTKRDYPRQPFMWPALEQRKGAYLQKLKDIIK
jgi:paraquat-inducible protein B